MADSVALVLARELRTSIRVKYSSIRRRAERERCSLPEAKSLVLAKSTGRALSLSGGDRRVAREMLVMAGPHPAALDAYARLRQDYGEEVAALAYEFREDVALWTTKKGKPSDPFSLTDLCEIITIIRGDYQQDEDMILDLGCFLDWLSKATVSGKQFIAIFSELKASLRDGENFIHVKLKIERQLEPDDDLILEEERDEWEE